MAVLSAATVFVLAASVASTGALAMSGPDGTSGRQAASHGNETDLKQPSPVPATGAQAPGRPIGADLYESDPFLLLAQGRYFLYTSDVPGHPTINVPVTSATTIGAWSPVIDALPVLPPWAASGYTWAPDVHRFGSTYMLYFTAIVRGWSPAMECIGAAVGPTPVGPFVAFPKPMICQAGLGGSIDPRVFDSAGATWMLWKSDQNIGGSTVPTELWSQPLSDSGRALIGSPVELMGTDEAWQGTIVEAPDLVEVGGVYWLFYSGNWFNQPAYAIGAARCAGPTGPCADASPWPLLASNNQGSGPGEASIYQDASGSTWMLYSPWHSPAPQPEIFPRPVYLTRVGILPSGPYLASGGPPPQVGPLLAPGPWSAP